MVKKILVLLPCFVIGMVVMAQVVYPGGQMPADTVRLFAPGILSDGLSNRDFSISPKGDEIFFTLQQPGFASSTILTMIKKNGKWSGPAVASFSGRYRDLEAAFAPDGQTVYFSSDRPLRGDSINSFDIWKVKRTRSGAWGTAENLGPVVNSGKNEFYPCVTKSGNLYFTAVLPDGKGSEDIVECKWTDTGYTRPASLPETVNSKLAEFNAFVDPAEQFIIFSSFGRDGEAGGGDLYISHRAGNNEWSTAAHLPIPVNSPGLDYCPFVSWDKKILIFTSSRAAKAFDGKSFMNYRALKKLLSAPGNGNDDLYWIKFNPAWLLPDN